MKKCGTLGAWTILGIVMLGLGMLGCDQGDDVAELSMSPESVVVSRNNETVRFSVTGGLRSLSMPLSWKVSDPDVGVIIAAEGTDADYIRLRSGVNIVIVRDQYGSEGYATVNSYGTVTARDENARPAPNGDDVPPQND